MKLRLPGEKVTRTYDAGLGEYAAVIGAHLKTSTNVGGTRAAAGEFALVDANEDDVVQLTWGGDIVELVSVGDLPKRFGADRVRGDADELQIPTWTPLAEPTRSGEGVTLSAVEFFENELARAVGDALLPKMIEGVESKFMPHPGLYRLSAEGELVDEVTSRLSPSDEPYLVLLHGTFSSTERSFRDLFGSDEWQQLYAAHGGNPARVLALEHHSVTESPARNALDLASKLPAGAKLHLLSYSRGGMVGDLIVRYPWSGEDGERAKALFAHESYAQVREELKLLEEQLQAGHRVERFLRVAAPAAGTLLASDRLDTYLNVILSLLTKVLEPAAPWVRYVKAVAMAFVKTRTRADVCPGLEAMMPHEGRGFVPFLNLLEPDRRKVPAEGQPIKNDLAIIAGDVQGGGIFDRIKGFFADLYYREPNDFVVDTQSMLRGVFRPGAVVHHHRGPKANHFGYFADADLRRRLTSYLANGDVAGFEPLQIRSASRGTALGYGSIDSADLVARPGKPVIVILPGIMGSHLQRKLVDKVEPDRIWVDLWDLAWGGLTKHLTYAPGQVGIEPGGVVRQFYADLAKYLNEQHHVEFFPFDWRRSIEDSAEALDRYLTELLVKHPGVPVRLIAHSMGGLVSRACIAKNAQLWQRVVSRGGRLVMLGTPNFGSYVPATVFTYQHELMQAIARIDVTASLEDLTLVVKGFPGLVEMLPRRGDQDLLSIASWKGIEAHAPALGTLQAALRFREWLDPRGIDPASMVYVAGRAETPVAIRQRNGKVEFKHSYEGDGTVPWALGLLPGVSTYYVDAQHGELANHGKAFAAYAELLAAGRTAKLATSPAQLPAPKQGWFGLFRAGGGVEVEEQWRTREWAGSATRYYPSEADLLRMLLGGKTETLPSAPPVQIDVHNTNVKYATAPVVVGHYLGDSIVSAEWQLDRGLGGRLSRDHRLGQYPGAINTSRIYRAGPGDQGAAGAIVVGLGSVGELTRQRLVSTLTFALVGYGLAELERSGGTTALELTVASLLVGTWGTRLTLSDSLGAIVSAVALANEKLRDEAMVVPVRFVKVQIIELYRSEAVEAAREALELELQAPHRIAVHPIVIDGKDPRRSRPKSPYQSGWSRRVSIGALPGGKGLEYEVVTDAARTDERKRCVDWKHVTPLLEAARRGDPEAPATLFQYLLPRVMIEGAEQSADLVLCLDQATAAIPWELLGRRADGQRPLGVRVGVLRNLKVQEPPEVMRAGGKRALVVGEPGKVGLPPLPGAAAEATHVSQVLSEFGYDAPALVQASADEIFTALYREEYDIVHIAAHGEFWEEERSPSDHPLAPGESSRVPRSGVVLEDGRHLTACEFENLRAVPSIVFLNCCHLGKMDELRVTQPGAWAANLAEQLIRMGVSVVVVAGWAVGDAAAKTFASSFYAGLLRGRDLMSAVRQARQDTQDVCGMSDLTWGAYQVYGGADFTMRQAPASFEAAVTIPHFVSVEEVVAYVRDVAASADVSRRGELLAVLGEVQDKLDVSWQSRGEIHDAFGEAFKTLGDYVAARASYQAALGTSSASLAAAEQLCSVEARLFTQQWKLRAEQRQGQLSNDALIGMLETSMERLRGLVSISPTAERWSLLGAATRRYAKVTPADGKPGQRRRSELVEDACTAYCNAVELSVRSSSKALYYPLIALQQVLLTKGIARVDAAELARARGSATAPAPDDDWAAHSQVDIELLECASKLSFLEGASELTGEQLASAAILARRYREQLAKSGKQHHEDAVSDALDTMIELGSEPMIRKWLEAIRTELLGEAVTA